MSLSSNRSSLQKRKTVSEKDVADLLHTINCLTAVDGGKLSPVDFSMPESTLIDLPPISWVNYHKQGQSIKVTNSGFTAIVSGKWDNDRPYVCSGPLKGKYLFSQVHFHWGEHDDTGSEHSVDGIRYPLEMHVVHFKSDYMTQEEALSKDDGIAIMVHLFAVQEHRNPKLDQLTAVMQFIQSAHSSARLGQVPLAELVHPFDLNYFLYWGGVSSALGLHRILWFVSRKVLPVSSSQLAEFRMLCNMNGKPLKKNSSDPYPLQNRSLFLVSPSSQLDEAVYGASREPTRINIRSHTSTVLEIHDAEYKSLTGIAHRIPYEKQRVVIEDYEEETSNETRTVTEERPLRPDYMLDGIRIKNDVFINFGSPCGKRVCMGKVEQKYLTVGKVTPTSESVEQSCVVFDKNKHKTNVEPISEVKYEKYERKNVVNKQSFVGYTKAKTSQSSFNIRDSRYNGISKKESHAVTTQSDVDIKRKLYVHATDPSVEEACVIFEIAPTPLSCASSAYVYYPNFGNLSLRQEKTRLVPLGDTTGSSEVESSEKDVDFVKSVTRSELRSRTDIKRSVFEYGCEYEYGKTMTKSVTETVEKTYGKSAGRETRLKADDNKQNDVEDRRMVVDKGNEHRTLEEATEKTYSKSGKERTAARESQPKRILEMRVTEDNMSEETRYDKESRKRYDYRSIERQSKETDRELLEDTYSKSEKSGRIVDRESQRIHNLPEKQVVEDDTSIEMECETLKPRGKQYDEIEQEEQSTIVTTKHVRKTHKVEEEEKHTIQYVKTNVQETERNLHTKCEETLNEVTDVKLDTAQANNTKVYEKSEATLKKIPRQPYVCIKVVQRKPPNVQYEINEPLKRKKITAYYKTPIIRKVTDPRPHVCYRIYEPLTSPKITEILKVPVNQTKKSVHHDSRYQNKHIVKKTVPREISLDTNDGIRPQPPMVVTVNTRKQKETVYEDEYITVHGKVYRRVSQKPLMYGQKVQKETVPDVQPSDSKVSLDNPVSIILKQKNLSKDIVPKPKENNAVVLTNTTVMENNRAKYYITSIKQNTIDMCEEKIIYKKAQYVVPLPSELVVESDENTAFKVTEKQSSTSETTTQESQEIFSELKSKRSETILMKSDSEETLRVEVLKHTTEYGAEDDDKQGVESDIEEMKSDVDNSEESVYQEDVKKMVKDTFIQPLIEDLDAYHLHKNRESFKKNERNKEIHTVKETISGKRPDCKAAVTVETTTRKESEPESKAVYQNVNYNMQSSQHQTRRENSGVQEVIEVRKVVTGKIKRFNEVKTHGRTLKPPEEKRSEYPIRSGSLIKAKSLEDVVITVKPSNRNDLKSNCDTGSSQKTFKDTQIRLKHDSDEDVKVKRMRKREDVMETEEETKTIKEERKEISVKKQTYRSSENKTNYNYKSILDNSEDQAKELEILYKTNDEELRTSDENSTDSSKSLGDKLSEVLLVNKLKKEEITNNKVEEEVRSVVDVHEERDSQQKVELIPVVGTRLRSTGSVEETVTISERIYEENVSYRTERHTERISVRTESETHTSDTTRYTDNESGKSNSTCEENKSIEPDSPMYEVYYGEMKGLDNKTTGRNVKPEIVVSDETGMESNDYVQVIMKEEIKEPEIFIVNKIPKDRLSFLEALPVESPGSTRIVKNRLKPQTCYRIFRKVGVTNSRFYFGNINPPSIPYITEHSKEPTTVDNSKVSRKNSETTYVEDVTITDKRTYAHEYTQYKTVTLKAAKNEHTNVNNCVKTNQIIPKVTLKIKEKLKNQDGLNETSSMQSENLNKKTLSIKTEKVKDDAGEDSVVIYIRQEKTPTTHIQPTITIDYTKTKDMTVSDLDTQNVCIREVNPTTSEIVRQQYVVPKKGDEKSDRVNEKEHNETSWSPLDKSLMVFPQQSLTVAYAPIGARSRMLRNKTKLVWKNKSMGADLTSNESVAKPEPSGKSGVKIVVADDVDSTGSKSFTKACCSEYYPDTDPLAKAFPSTFSLTWPKEQAEVYSGYQSPIRMYPSKFSVRVFPKLQFCGHWSCRGQAIMENTGSTIRLTLNVKTSLTVPYLKGGPLFDHYMFEELRFRWGKTDCSGAEHVFDNDRRCLEAQFFHYKKTYENMTNAINYPDGVACVSVTFQTGGHLDEDFDDIIDGVKRVFKPDTSIKFPASAIFKWLKKHIDTSQSYITYPGSLTIRPFYESVIWIVIVDPFVFCCQQSIQFRRVLGRSGLPLKNFRKSQPHNNRPIYYVPLK